MIPANSTEVEPWVRDALSTVVVRLQGRADLIASAASLAEVLVGEVAWQSHAALAWQASATELAGQLRAQRVAVDAVAARAFQLWASTRGSGW